MLQKTKGIVLHSLKYSENSIIVKIYTESFGLVSYLVRSVRSKKSALKTGIFQPLTLLEMVVYHKKNRYFKPSRKLYIVSNSFPFLMILRKVLLQFLLPRYFTRPYAKKNKTRNCLILFSIRWSNWMPQKGGLLNSIFIFLWN
jgi:hypothetical protein